MTAHIESKKEDIAEVVLMPGDPLRAKYIAENFLTDYKLVNKVRNMFGYTGYYKGKRVTVFASGMGIPSIGIYSYELYKFYDVKKIIRIGTSGSFNKNIKTAAKLANIPLKIGKTITSDVFDLYSSSMEKFKSNYPEEDYLAVEMEAFGLFYMANRLGREASCLMTVVDSFYDEKSLTSEEREKSLNEMITIALESVLI